MVNSGIVRQTGNAACRVIEQASFRSEYTMWEENLKDGTLRAQTVQERKVLKRLTGNYIVTA